MSERGVYVVLGEPDLDFLARAARHALTNGRSQVERAQAEPGQTLLDVLETDFAVTPADVRGWSLTVSPVPSTASVHLELWHDDAAQRDETALSELAKDLSRVLATTACSWSYDPTAKIEAVEVWRDGDLQHEEELGWEAPDGATAESSPLGRLATGLGTKRTARETVTFAPAESVSVPLDAPLDPKRRGDLADLRQRRGGNGATASSDAARLAGAFPSTAPASDDAGPEDAITPTVKGPPQDLTALYAILGVLLALALGLTILFTVLASRQPA